ncbi:hypothetical protein BGX28_003402 [Mortierella sp. GBA30]|nr:hypothetical protein BGX28_003402 [Mortierella sp. GBA30]
MSGDDLATFVTLMRERSPKLKYLHLPGRFRDEEFLLVVNPFRSMEFFLPWCKVASTSLFISRVASQWSNTLSFLSLGSMLCISSIDIQLLLTSCPHLRSFSISSPTSAMKLSDVVQSPWVCLGLNTLVIPFKDETHERVEQKSLEEHWKQEAWTRDWVKRTYSQLENLKVQWMGVFRKNVTNKESLICGLAPVVHMDMSMSSGLGMLEGLKNLQKVVIGGLESVAMEQEELEWMLQSWPRLDRLGVVKEGVAAWATFQLYKSLCITRHYSPIDNSGRGKTLPTDNNWTKKALLACSRYYDNSSR